MGKNNSQHILAVRKSSNGKFPCPASMHTPVIIKVLHLKNEAFPMPGGYLRLLVAS